MNAQGNVIRKLLWKEVANKGPSACAGFILAAIFVFFQYFGLIKFKTLIQTASVVAILSNIGRFYLSRKIFREGPLPGNIVLLKIAIWINAVAWGVVFFFTAYELDFFGLNFILMLVMMVGFGAASLVTLGYDKSIYFPFQILTVLPVMCLSLYEGLKGNYPGAEYLAFLLLIFIFYQLKQFKSYRSEILERFRYQIELEESLDEVERSKEALIEQTAKLVHASQISALGDMAGGLAHEVNNSLQVIMGSTQQIQRELSHNNSHTSSIENKLKQSLLAIQKIKSVIEGLKYFSLQMEPQQKETVPLEDIIQRALNYTFELTQAHHIRFNRQDTPKVKITCHPFQITQIIFNLIKNADDALNDTPHENRWIDISYELEKDCILIKIKNGGRLITPENQNKLFRPFFSTKEINQGSGLSLSVSRGIALDHKGDLFYDETQKFTTFILKLPKA